MRSVLLNHNSKELEYAFVVPQGTSMMLILLTNEKMNSQKRGTKPTET